MNAIANLSTTQVLCCYGLNELYKVKSLGSTVSGLVAIHWLKIRDEPTVVRAKRVTDHERGCASALAVFTGGRALLNLAGSAFCTHFVCGRSLRTVRH